MTEGPMPEPRRERIYHLIRWVFGADLAIGLGLAGAGYWIWQAPQLWIFGLGLAVVGLSMLLLFGFLRRQAEMRDRRPDIDRN
jgi:hypothetical protein